MLRKNIEALNSEQLFRPSQRIPQTGIYELIHANGNVNTVVLVREEEFPTCRECGTQVRFRLVRAAPHIKEDEDFR
jgi:hypothetical protein